MFCLKCQYSHWHQTEPSIVVGITDVYYTPFPTVTNVLAEIYILTYTLSKLSVFPACQSISINYISTFQNTCSHVRVLWQLGIFLLFLLYIRRDVLLKYRNVLDISEYVNEMMGSSFHQPP